MFKNHDFYFLFPFRGTYLYGLITPTYFSVYLYRLDGWTSEHDLDIRHYLDILFLHDLRWIYDLITIG